MDEKIDGKIKIERTREKERGREEAKEKIIKNMYEHKFISNREITR